MPRSILACLAGALLATATACGHWLTWSAQPPAPTLAGKVTIAVADHRHGPLGGDDPSVIGTQRGVLLVKSELRLSEPTEAADTLRELVGQAALSAGIGVAPDGAGSARIDVEILSMWCEGVLLAYTKATLGGTLTVLGPDGAVRVASMPLALEGGAGDCRSAYNHLLTNVYSQVTALLSQPAVKAAVSR